MRWTISPLSPDDCDELGEVHVRCWREAYAGILPADQLAALDPRARAERWHQIAATPGDTGTWVARTADGRLVGFASAGPARDDAPPTPGELWAIYVLAEVQGSGLADLLMETALGDRDAMLWVFEENPRARAFYARHGFAPDGERSTYGESQVPEIRLVRRR